MKKILFLKSFAGVGKSLGIKCYAAVAEKLLRNVFGEHPNFPRVILSAFTGKAASLIGMRNLVKFCKYKYD